MTAAGPMALSLTIWGGGERKTGVRNGIRLRYRIHPASELDGRGASCRLPYSVGAP